MSNDKYKYLKYKTKYIQLKNKNKNMEGGKLIILGGKLDPKIKKEIDEIATAEIKNLKTINIKDICGLNMRVYERKKGVNKISPIIYTPPKVSKYIDNTNNYGYVDYYESKYGDITKNNLKNLILDFGILSDKRMKIKVAFADNYRKNKQRQFEVNLPITLIGFIEQLFDHFDLFGLSGYPDNGGIDTIKYNKKDDIYLIETWS